MLLPVFNYTDFLQWCWETQMKDNTFEVPLSLTSSTVVQSMKLHNLQSQAVMAVEARAIQKVRAEVVHFGQCLHYSRNCGKRQTITIYCTFTVTCKLSDTTDRHQALMTVRCGERPISRLIVAAHFTTKESIHQKCQQEHVGHVQFGKKKCLLPLNDAFFHKFF